MPTEPKLWATLVRRLRRSACHADRGACPRRNHQRGNDSAAEGSRQQRKYRCRAAKMYLPCHFLKSFQFIRRTDRKNDLQARLFTRHVTRLRRCLGLSLKAETRACPISVDALSLGRRVLRPPGCVSQAAFQFHVGWHASMDALRKSGSYPSRTSLVRAASVNSNSMCRSSNRARKPGQLDIDNLF